MACWKFCTISFFVFHGRNKVTKVWKGAQILPEMSFLAELLLSDCVLLKLLRRSVKRAAWECKSLIICFIKSENCWGNEIYTVWLIQCIPISKETNYTSDALMRSTKVCETDLRWRSRPPRTALSRSECRSPAPG